MSKVFCGVPLYSRSIDFAACVSAFTGRASREHKVLSKPWPNSLTPASCNALWCEALNLQASDGFQWYAQLHGDCWPHDFWIDRLIEIAEQNNADFVSASVPMKDRSGVFQGRTSTAIAMPGNIFRPFCMLTQSQVLHESFPVSFDINSAADAIESLPEDLRIEKVPRSYLLANTGCMICRLDRPWSQKAYFDNPNRIEKVNSKWIPATQAEDWFFSQLIAELGGKVMVTKSVRVKHWGLTDFDSHEIWGVKRDA
jgi:hypothetical protein